MPVFGRASEGEGTSHVVHHHRMSAHADFCTPESNSSGCACCEADNRAGHLPMSPYGVEARHPLERIASAAVDLDMYWLAFAAPQDL